ncbi:MAG: hypothetical protein ACLTSJ_10305 [Alistipes communis]
MVLELARRSTDSSPERVRINDNGKYEYFGNTDWTKAFYKDELFARHNLSISSGGKTPIITFRAAFTIRTASTASATTLQAV